jgi:DNA-binding SARP family transcriptional activator
MSSVHDPDMRDMLGAAGRTGWAFGGSGRSGLIGRLASTKARLPRFVQRRLPSDGASALLFLAYAWTSVFALISIVVAISQPAGPLQVFLGALYLAAGIAGLWFGRKLIVVIPSTLLWLVIAQVYVFSPKAGYLGLLIFGACTAVGIWVAVQAVVRERSDLVRSIRIAEAATNQLGWDLHKLSSQIPLTDQAVERVGVYSDLRVGELQRHFDQITSAAIQGGMQHLFSLKGVSGSVHDLPGVFLVDTMSWMRMGGSGASSVQLGMTGTTTDELTGESFVAVFERSGPDGIDTIRAVVPSQRHCRAYVDQLLTSWSARLGPNTKAELMVRRYASAISQAVSSDSSYVGDRLNATLRLPAADRPTVTVVGEQLDHHAILVGALRFGPTGALYQLFPIALVRSLLALIEGRPLPPPAGLPPTDRTSHLGIEPETPEPAGSAAATSNGSIPDLQIRTMGGLRITAGAEDLTSALLDRKVLAFLWLHLLARTLRNPADSITRTSLADELSPGLDSSAQRSRLRGRLSELRNQLPAALGRRLKVEGERITLDLGDCAIDVTELVDAARTYGGSSGVLTSVQLAELDSIVTGVQGSFLPEWDDIEQHVNSGRSGAGEVVRDLRNRTDHSISALLRALGAGYLAHGKAEAAIAPLERALALSPDDEAAARSLSTACVQTGRLSRAEELRKDFSIV